MSDDDAATLALYFGQTMAQHHKDVGQLRVDITKLHATTRSLEGCD